MPDNSRPSPNPSPQVEPGELNFAQPVSENPRIKRRSLKVKSATTAKALSASPQAAPSVPAPSPTAGVPEPESAAVSEAANPRPTPAASPVSTPSSTPVFSPNPSPSTHAHPSTLYYSTGARKVKEDAPPMKTSNPASATPPSASASSTASVHATPLRSASAAPTTARAASVVDYRANIERQAREQKSVGNVLSYAVYILGGLFVFGVLLAGYGTYILSKQIHQQSVTVNDLDTRFSEKTQTLTAQLATTDDALAQAEAQLKREQDVILHQQDTINKLTTDSETTLAALKQERQARTTETAIRASETSALRAKVRTLETKTSFQ